MQRLEDDIAHRQVPFDFISLGMIIIGRVPDEVRFELPD